VNTARVDAVDEQLAGGGYASLSGSQATQEVAGMGNSAWGAGHHTGVGEGLALGEEIGRALGEKKGLQKGLAIGVAIGIAASAAAVSAGVDFKRLDPRRLVPQRLLGREQNVSATNSNPVAEKDADAKHEYQEGTSTE
jgi:hypothetical protein